MISMVEGVPWWGVAAIAAVASLITGLTAAGINWSTKNREIRATDRRQWDLHKYETVSKFMSLCDALADVTWSSDPKGQTRTYTEANRERIRLLLISERLGKSAQNLLGAAVKHSTASNQFERDEAQKEKDRASQELIEWTQKDLGRGA